MRLITPILSLAVGGLLVGAALFAQDAGMPPMARPTAEHAKLKERVGTWNAAFKMHAGPQTIEDKATMTWSMMGDFWLVGNYDGHMMGSPFQGHEMTTYDPDTKQFVHYWFDSSATKVSVSHGTWDEATHTLTFTSDEKSEMSGKKMVSRILVEGPDSVKYTMMSEGDTAPMMEIAYTRRK